MCYIIPMADVPQKSSSALGKSSVPGMGLVGSILKLAGFIGLITAASYLLKNSEFTSPIYTIRPNAAGEGVPVQTQHEYDQNLRAREANPELTREIALLRLGIKTVEAYVNQDPGLIPGYEEKRFRFNRVHDFTTSNPKTGEPMSTHRWGVAIAPGVESDNALRSWAQVYDNAIRKDLEKVINCEPECIKELQKQGIKFHRQIRGGEIYWHVPPQDIWAVQIPDANGKLVWRIFFNDPSAKVGADKRSSKPTQKHSKATPEIEI
jgi:hypothetical protein